MSPRPDPGSAPRLLLDLDFAAQPLIVQSPTHGSATGQPFASDVLVDFTLDAELGLADAGPEDRFGLFFRQTADERYAACTVNAQGAVALGLVDNGPALVIADGTLPPLQATTRLSVVVCGPMVACLVNGVAVLGGVLDARYTQGRVGALLVHTSAAAQPRLEVRWAQARALFAAS